MTRACWICCPGRPSWQSAWVRPAAAQPATGSLVRYAAFLQAGLTNLVRIEGTLSDAGMKLLQHGLELDGVKLKPARVSWQNEHQLRFVLREGRKRQIRRMCELVGLVVTGLKRVRSGSVPLGALPVGQWRYLRRDEKF